MSAGLLSLEPEEVPAEAAASPEAAAA